MDPDPNLQRFGSSRSLNSTMDFTENIQNSTEIILIHYQETVLLIVLSASLMSLPFFYMFIILYRWLQSRKNKKLEEHFDPPPKYCEQEPPPTYEEAIKIEIGSNLALNGKCKCDN